MTGNIFSFSEPSPYFFRTQRLLYRSSLLRIAAPCALLLIGSGYIAHAQDAGGGQSAPPTAPAAPPAGGPAAPGTTAASAAVSSPGYQIAEDDVIDIQVLDHPEVNRSYQVPAEGTIDIPYVGELNVIGMTLRDLKASLVKSYGKQYYHPDVILAAHPAQMNMDVVGVTHNGKYPIKHNEHVLEVIATAGGLPADRPENYKATLIKGKTGVAVPINLSDLYSDNKALRDAQNVVVDKDDTLYIEDKAALSTTLQVIGQVGHPGQVTVPRDGSILAVMQAAGGPTAAAALSKAVIKRGDHMIPIDLRDYQKTGYISTETLQAGDDLIIPENKMEYFVYGAGGSGVKTYPDDRTLTVFSALGYNSPSTEGVDLSKVVLLHRVPGSPEQQKSVVDVQHMLKTGDMRGDLAVVPGDSIVIPPSRSRRGLGYQEILGILGSLGGLVGLYSLFK